MGLSGTVGPSSQRECRPGFGLRLALALVLSGLLTVPPAGAMHGEVGISTEPLASHCEGAWEGYEGPLYRFCYSHSRESPDYGSEERKDLEVPPNASRAQCPASFDGYSVHHNTTNSTVGFCARYETRVPERTQGYPVLHVRRNPCHLPEDNQTRGRDPVVRVNDGGAAVCVVPIVDPGPGPPEHNVSVKPCEPETVDPEVKFGGGSVQVCLDFRILVWGSRDVAETIRRVQWVKSEVNATAHETVRLVIELAPTDLLPIDSTP